MIRSFEQVVSFERSPGWNCDIHVHPVLITSGMIISYPSPECTQHFLPMGEKKKSLQWIYNPTDDSVCLFVRFMDTLANFRFQDWKIFGHAPYRDDYGLVKPVGLRLFTVLYFSVQMALFPGSKFSCKLLSICPNSWNESRLCDVFSEQFGCVLTDHYFFIQATLASTRASRTCTAQTCLQPDWLYQFKRFSIYSIKMCSSRKSRGFIMMQKDKSWKLDRFTTKGTFSLEEKKQTNQNQYMPSITPTKHLMKNGQRNLEHRLLHRIRHLHISQNNTPCFRLLIQ